MRMLLGLTRPTGGTSRVLGRDSQSLTPPVRGRIGYVTESHAGHEWMTVAQEAYFASQFYAHWNRKLFKSIIDHFALPLDAKVRSLTMGERAGLSMAVALAPEPELLVLDDPTLGLDPLARHSVLQTMLRVTRDEGRTVFFSSHLLEDVEHVADHVAVLDRSQLRMSGPIDDLGAAMRLYRISFAPGRMPATLPPMRGLLSERRAVHNMVLLVVLNPGDDTRVAIASLGAERVEERPVSLADAVMSYLGTSKPEGMRPDEALTMAGGAS
jgi:ABC-2 type transport system ATP-binding protein